MKDAPSFTLIELMAASAVLSAILLMMVGMQDQMSRAWSNANRRTDATREASAACRMMAEDLSCLVFRAFQFDNQKSSAPSLTDQGIPFLFSSNGTGPISISNQQPGTAYFFGLTARKPSGTAPGDWALVGYYVASASPAKTNANGTFTTNYNLYRYFVPATSAVSTLNTWFSTAKNKRTASLLFQPDPSRDDILARNTCNLRINAYNRVDGSTKGLLNKVSNGLNYQFVAGGGASSSYYSGNKLQVELTVYPEDYAQRIPLGSWGDPNNVRRFARSYEFRLDVNRD